MDKLFSTKWHVAHLSQFGFSISSDKVKLFKQCAITSDRNIQPKCSPSDFMQWVSYNVERNTCTLTGKGTFHGMGTISASLDPIKFCDVIKRLKQKELSGFSGFTESNIPIISYIEVFLILESTRNRNFTKKGQLFH